jgi:ABC-type branched-subunit amino acid transport system ATPase component
MIPALEFTALEGGYGDATVIRRLSGAVAAGECLAVLGRNGVGKTTLARHLAGFLKPFSGTVHLAGREVTGRPPPERRALGLGYAPQERVVFDDLSVGDNLTLTSRRGGLGRYEEYFAAFPWLGDRLRQHAGTLSGGEKKILSFVRTLAEGNPVTLLDEPSEGVQRENIDRMAAFVRAAKTDGRAFVIVEQNIAFMEAIMDRVLILDHGECVLDAAAGDTDRKTILGYLRV